MAVNEFIEAARIDGQKIERLIRSFYSQLPSRRTFIDGGAHHGYHTSFARQFFTDRVVSIEASPKTYIQHIVSQARLDTGLHCEVTPLNCAIGHRDTQGSLVKFFFSETHPGRSTVNTKLWDEWAKGAVIYDAPILAAVLEIDDVKRLCAYRSVVDFIKLDIEGNEINALRGAKGVLKSDRPSLVMEFGLRPQNEALYGESCSAFVEMMATLGYRLYTPWAERAEDLIVSGYPFWYLFCLPDGPRIESYVDLLRRCFDESVSEANPTA